MTRLAGLACFAGFALATLGLAAQDDAAAKAQKPEPRVLLFGDSSFGNLLGQVTRGLSGKAKVVRSPLGYLDSGAVLERLDEILGKEPWSLVCLNIGRSDMMYRDPRTQAVRAMSRDAGGVQAQSVDQHTANLERLLRKIRGTGAKIVWVSTLPLPPGRNPGTLRTESVARYNAADAKTMKRLRIQTVDVHAQIQAELAKVKNRRGLGRAYNQLMRKDLSGPTRACIAAKLGLQLEKRIPKRKARKTP